AAAVGGAMSTVLRPTSAVPAAARARLLGPGTRRRAGAAAALSLAAAWVHLAYAAPHLRQWGDYGAFFLATGAGQALFAPLLLRRPRAGVIAVGVAGNVAILGRYVVSRAHVPPLGPHARVPEVG